MVTFDVSVCGDRAIQGYYQPTTHIPDKAQDIVIIPLRPDDLNRWNEYEIYVKVSEPLDETYRDQLRHMAQQTRGERDKCTLILHTGDPEDPIYTEVFDVG